MKNKYYAKSCIINGMSFDSKKEAKRYQELMLLEKSGFISNLQRQVKYVLIPPQYKTFKRYGNKGKLLKDGKQLLERECSYVADFVYELDGKTIVEDAKSKATKTKEYIIKRKLMLYIHGIAIKEV